MGAGAREPVARWSRFPAPLIKPDLRISRLRLSDGLHRNALAGAAPRWVGRSLITPRWPNTTSSRNCRAPRECTLCRLRKKCRTLSKTIVVDRPIGDQSGPVAEVARPASQQPIQLVTDLPPGPDMIRSQHGTDLLLDPRHTLLRRTRPPIPRALFLEAMRPERVSQKIKPSRPGIDQLGLRLVPTLPRSRPRDLSGSECQVLTRVSRGSRRPKSRCRTPAGRAKRPPRGRFRRKRRASSAKDR